jgi:hypothetical protein
VVLILIVVYLIVSQTQLIEFFGKGVVRSSLSMKEESFDSLPKISEVVFRVAFLRTGIVNLVGTESCVLEFPYRRVCQTSIIKYADNSTLCFDYPLCLHFWKGKWQERTPCGIKKNNNA